MNHSNKDRSYDSLSMSRDDNFSVFGYGRGGVVYRITNFYFHKVDLIADRNNVLLTSSLSHFTKYPMVS